MKKGIFLLTCFMIAFTTVCFAQNSKVEITNVAIQKGKSQKAISFHEEEAAYLYVGLKNNGATKVNNLDLEILYYTKENFLIQKSIIKHALTEPILPGEEKKYRIELEEYDLTPWGTIKEDGHGQYPYKAENELSSFKVDVTNIKSDWW